MVTQKDNDPFVAMGPLSSSSVRDYVLFSNNRTSVISKVTTITEGETVMFYSSG